MPRLTRWFIKSSFIYLVLALAVGVLLAAQDSWKLQLAGLFPVYIHLLVEGWLTFLIIGVAYWMFPKFTRERPRGSSWLGWLSFFSLQAGLLLRVVAEPLHSARPAALLGWMLVISAALQWIGGMAFVVNSWNRVKEK